MFYTIQLLALVQGLFLLLVLVRNRKLYKKTPFWLFVGSIVSVQLYLLGDDNNLFFNHVDLFFFDITLFVTFLFLFIQYKTSPKTVFHKRDLLYFIPNLVYIIIEIAEFYPQLNLVWVESFEILIELTFLVYFGIIIYRLWNSKVEKWMLYFMIPMMIISSFSISNEVINILGFDEIIYFNDQNFNSFLIVLVAFLYYTFSFKLITSPKALLPIAKLVKYKTSSLAMCNFSMYEKELIRLMEKEKLYTNPKLSIHDIAHQLNVPRQHISEVLNVHMQISFQDFVNEYRVNAFIDCLQKEQYAHYTLFGIASEAGFNSKSSFNTTFKKIKGLTPSEYKKNH